jgi:hypothetical protein
MMRIEILFLVFRQVDRPQLEGFIRALLSWSFFAVLVLKIITMSVKQLVFLRISFLFIHRFSADDDLRKISIAVFCGITVLL